MVAIDIASFPHDKTGIIQIIGLPWRDGKYVKARAGDDKLNRHARGLIKAIVHNDYSYGATPKFEFFPNDWITSMGELVSWTRKIFSADFQCLAIIMRVFRDLEIVEHLDSGIPRILKAYGKTAFEIRNSFVRGILPYSQPFEETEQAPGSHRGRTSRALDAQLAFIMQ